MSIWTAPIGQLFKRKTVAEAVDSSLNKVVVVTNQRKYINRYALNGVGLDAHHWAMTPDGVGIIVGCDGAGEVEVNLVKPDGTTYMTLSGDDKAVPKTYVGNVEAVRRAYIDEVPACRHPDVDHVEHMRSKGYRLSSEVEK